MLSMRLSKVRGEGAVDEGRYVVVVVVVVEVVVMIRWGPVWGSKVGAKKGNKVWGEESRRMVEWVD